MPTGRKLWGIVISIALFVLPQLAKLLESNVSLQCLFGLNAESAGWAQGGVFLVALCIFSWKAFSDEILRPKERAELDRVSLSVEHLQELIVGEYCRFVEKETQQSAPVIRVNTMLLCKPKKGKSFLKIFFSSSNLETRRYSGAEQDIRWASGDGCCGEAFERQRVALYDSTDKEHSNAAERLNEEQKDMTCSIGSIVSIPISHPKTRKPIAVLNLDSKENFESTRFHCESFLKTIKPFLSHLGHILGEYSEGVKEK